MKPRTVVLLAALSAFGPLLATLAAGCPAVHPLGHRALRRRRRRRRVRTLAAYAVAAVGVRRGDARTVLVGVAFASMGAILAVHGLVTPGFLVENTNLSPITGGATVPVGAAVLALGTIPASPVPARIPLLLRASVLISGVVLAVSIIGLVDPALVPAVPSPAAPVPSCCPSVGGAFLTLVTVRAARTWLLTRRSSDLAVVAGVAWLGAALGRRHAVPATTSPAGGSVTGSRSPRSRWSAPRSPSTCAAPLVAAATGDLPATALVRDAEAVLGARVSALLLDLQRADRSTGEHTRRVALNAVLVGEALGLSRGRLRGLALGGILHDIGKLGISVAILQKPARSTRPSAPRSSVIRRSAPRCSISSAASGRMCGRWSSTTTSGPTAPATRAAWPATSCRSTRASSRCATCSTRWSRSARTARRGRSNARSPRSPTAPGRSSTRAASRR